MKLRKIDKFNGMVIFEGDGVITLMMPADKWKGLGEPEELKLLTAAPNAGVKKILATLPPRVNPSTGGSPVSSTRKRPDGMDLRVGFPRTSDGADGP